MKKILFKSIVAALSAVAISASSAFADFTDMPTDAESKAALELAVENGLLTGYDTGEIRPYNNIKRCEMAAIIVRAFGAEDVPESFNFGDVRPEHWYYDVMRKAVKMGVFKGDGTNLNPENDITFQEAFTVLSRVFDLQAQCEIDNVKFEVGLLEARPEKAYPILNNYADGGQVADWAVSTVAAIAEGGYWKPADNMLHPTEPINRTQFAVLMNNLVTTYIDEAGVYDSLPAGNVVIRKDGVTVKGFNAPASKIIVGAGVGDEEIVIDSDVVVERLVAYSGMISLRGEFDFVKLIGTDAVGKLDKPKIKVQGVSKNGSRFSLGVKEV